MRICLFIWIALCLPAAAAERVFNLSEQGENKPPAGFRSAVAGEGKAGDWRVLMDSVPPLLEPLTPQAPSVAKRAVLGQLAQNPQDEHFPLLIYEGETFGDFTFTTRFKTVSGTVEQMAGIAFRLQDERNFYVVRASSLGNNVRFYKVLNGERGPLVGPATPIPTNTWHELTIECRTNQIRCLLNGKEVISLSDRTNPFLIGKIAFWTKSDSVTYFSDSRITYVPRVPPAQALVTATLKEFPKLLGLQVFVAGTGNTAPLLVGSSKESELGTRGGEAEQAVLRDGAPYYGKTRNSVSVLLPLRDRNGDIIASVRVVMGTFSGQTEQNAIARAMPIVRHLKDRVQALQDLAE